MSEEIFVTKASMPPLEEYIEEIKDIWETHWMTNVGAKHIAFRQALEQKTGAKHVTLYTNGHLALENALAVFDFPKGSEVITTPFTFASTTHAIVRNGLVPVFCDINENDYTINADLIEELITDKTVAILPVHVYGYICDDSKITAIAKKHNLKVIYDAAHAFGESYEGRSIATFGDISMFSFHATKVFNTIEGGALAYNDDAIVQKLYDMKNFGIRNAESVAFVGGNAKMNEFQAAMGLCNLRHLDENIANRKKIVALYRELLDGIEGIVIPTEQTGMESNYAYFPVVFENYKYTRDELFDFLAEEKIHVRKYFYPITCDYECYADADYAKRADVPVARRIAKSVLTLPLYPELSEKDVRKICQILKEGKNYAG